MPYLHDSISLTGGRCASRAAGARDFQRLLPGVKPKWTHVWAGAFGESSDGLPIIDAVPDMPHCFTVMGFGGNGTVYSMIAAQLMPGLIKGRPSADAALFQFH